MRIPANVIVNADDFGANNKKNFAITQCFITGLINSASIITNMDGLQEAIELSRKNGFEDKIGLHVNLAEGKPLTNLSSTRLIDKDGFFIKNLVDKKFIYLSRKEKQLIAHEIESQLNVLLSYGIKPTHINSHYHVHTLPWLAQIFIKISKKYKIKLRLAQTWNENNNFLVPLYRAILNRVYSLNKINFSDKFETCLSYKSSEERLLKKKYVIEIMVHPDLNSKDELYDSYDGTNLKITCNDLQIIDNNYKRSLQSFF